ncbi:MAG: helix-turn-helix transcriptional regulator [Lewinella sp.]|nr:helix-turn-helix transcriptional regulator [Lewinella sp.]
MKAAMGNELEQRLRNVPGFEEGRRQRENIFLLGERIRELRETELRISQAEAARLVGMEQPELSRIENGVGKRGPSYLTITRIINAYQDYLRQTDPTVHVGLSINVSHDNSEEVAQNLLTEG